MSMFSLSLIFIPHLLPKTKFMSHNMHSTVNSRQSTVNSPHKHKRQHHNNVFPSSFSQNEVHVPQHVFESRVSTVNNQQSTVLTSTSNNTITNNVFPSIFPSSFAQNEVHVPQHAFDSRQSTVNSQHSTLNRKQLTINSQHSIVNTQ
jgi:hypothetical protein